MLGPKPLLEIMGLASERAPLGPENLCHLNGPREGLKIGKKNHCDGGPFPYNRGPLRHLMRLYAPLTMRRSLEDAAKQKASRLIKE